MSGRCSGGRVGRRLLGGRGELGRAGDTPATTEGFTVVELLVVMAIILVLAGLVLATSSYVHNKGARSRAEAEIAAMSAALENYKADNGVYPISATPDARANGDPSAQIYKDASLVLYRALSGDTDLDRQAEATSYMSFKPNQLYPSDQSMAVTFLKDPFGYSYGYSTAGQAGGTTGYNPTFDLWSTVGETGKKSGETFATYQLRWVKNW